jgi:hypothetical protein
MSYELNDVSFVSYEGEYSAGADLLIFDEKSLTPEQWEILGEVSDYSKMSYVKAILNGDDLSYWEEGR